MFKVKLVEYLEDGTITHLLQKKKGGSIESYSVNHSSDATLLAKVALVRFSEYFIFELAMPTANYKTIKELLAFEISRKIPTPASELKIFIRRFIINRNKSIVRVFVVRSELWDKALTDVSAEKFDLVTHPFMVLPANLNSKVYLSNFDKEHIFQLKNENWEMVAKEEDIPSLQRYQKLIAEYLMSADFSFDKSMLCDLPAELKLHRYRSWKLFLLLLVTLAIITGGLFFLVHLNDEKRLNLEISHANNEATYRLKYIRKNLISEHRRNLSRISQDILDEVPYYTPLEALETLSQKLPKYAWITGFRYTPSELNLVIMTSERLEDIGSSLSELPYFTVDSLRQQSNSQGGGSVYVTLKFTGDGNE